MNLDHADAICVRCVPAAALDATLLDALAGLLQDCVAGGASVGFLAPLAAARAQAYWRGVAEGVADGERRLLVAETATADARIRLVGSVQLVLAQMENQPHRADVSKLLVQRSARRHGLGAALMRAAEDEARRLGRTLLVLDTATPEADRLYARLGWQLCGTVPGYALMPDGAPCDTRYYYRQIAPA